jgi:hypothetical protein
LVRTAHSSTLPALAVEPRAVVSPGALSFGAVPVGQSSTTLTTTLSSIGTMDALIMYFARVIGPNAADFVIEHGPYCLPKPAVFGPGAPLEPNASRTTWLRFVPSAPGVRSATLFYGLDTAALALTGPVADEREAYRHPRSGATYFKTLSMTCAL